MIEVMIPVFVLLLFIMLMFAGPSLYLKSLKQTLPLNGVYMLYHKKCQSCKKAMHDLEDIMFVNFIDIAPVPKACMPKDTGKFLSESFSSGGRINAGSAMTQAQATFNHFLTGIGYKNEIPLFVHIENDEVVSTVTGYPNKWFDNKMS